MPHPGVRTVDARLVPRRAGCGRQVGTAGIALTTWVLRRVMRARAERMQAMAVRARPPVLRALSRIGPPGGQPVGVMSRTARK